MELRTEIITMVDADQSGPLATEISASEIKRLVSSAFPRYLASGDLLLDRFEIVRLIGSGGMGDVYEAVDRELHETIAVKMIRPELARNKMVLARFKNEVQLARRLSGPNICRIHELFPIRGNDGLVDSVFLTMEYLDGTTLADKLTEGRIPWCDAQAIASDICAGLTVMHKAGMIHRDLKSRNIMLVNRDGALRALLVDFGLAYQLPQSSLRDETGLTIPGAVHGTPGNMAPEQLEGRDATAASDLYAMGVILYQLASGRHPFASSNPLGAAVLRAKKLPPASSRANRVPRRWEIAIRTCLQYEPIERYESADELLRALNGNTFSARILEKWRFCLLFLLAASSVMLVCFWIVHLMHLTQNPEGVPAEIRFYFGG